MITPNYFQIFLKSLLFSFYRTKLFSIYLTLKGTRPSGKFNSMKSKELNGIKEIARRAGVSIGTVDRVLHDRQGVSARTKTKIQALIKELNYQPNKMASLLASKKTLNFAIIIPQVSTNTNYWDYPKKGIETAVEELKQLGVRIQYYLFDLDDERSFIKVCKKVLTTKADGIILAPSFIKESALFVEKLQAAKIPIVYINSDLPSSPALSYIGPDFFQSGRVAAQLTSQAIKASAPIMVVNISTDLESDHHLLRKVQGFEQYFDEKQKNRQIIQLHIPQTRIHSIEKIIKEALAAHPKCQAFFVTNSQVHILAKILAKQLPSFFLIGYDFTEKNIDFMKAGSIDFLICHRPKDQGYQAVMALYKQLYHNNAPEKLHYMPIDIITKENFMFYDS